MASDSIATTFGKVVDEFAGLHGKVEKTMSCNRYNDFSNAISNTDDLARGTDKDKLLAISSAKESAALMEHVLRIDVLSTAVKGLFTRMDTAAAHSDYGKPKFQGCISRLKEVNMAVDDRFAEASEQSSKLLGHLCIVHAMLRDLEPGETRDALLPKCENSFRKKQYLMAEARMLALLTRLLGGGASTGSGCASSGSASALKQEPGSK